jgi:hypothetical protein
MDSNMPPRPEGGGSGDCAADDPPPPVAEGAGEDNHETANDNDHAGGPPRYRYDPDYCSGRGGGGGGGGGDNDADYLNSSHHNNPIDDMGSVCNAEREPEADITFGDDDGGSPQQQRFPADSPFSAKFFQHRSYLFDPPSPEPNHRPPEGHFDDSFPQPVPGQGQGEEQKRDGDEADSGRQRRNSDVERERDREFSFQQALQAVADPLDQVRPWTLRCRCQ